MKSTLKTFLIALCCMSIAIVAKSQNRPPVPVPRLIPLNAAKSDEKGLQKNSLFRQNISAVKNFISEISPSYNAPAFETYIDLPGLNGGYIRFKLRNSHLLSESFQKQYSGIKTFEGVSDDGSYRARLTLSQLGIAGKYTKTATGESWYIQTLGPGNPEIITIGQGSIPQGTNSVPVCKTDSTPVLPSAQKTALLNNTAGNDDGRLHTFRLAVAATGEYTTYFGGQANALAEIVNTVNNVTDIFEQDLAVSFTLVTSYNIIFTDANTDPFSDGDQSNIVLSDNQIILNNPVYLGTDSFDLGIAFSTYSDPAGSQGIATPNSVGNSYKGRGAVCNPRPRGRYFDGIVAHEIGHMFGAMHTFSSDVGDYFPASAWEVGDGSTIMSYAGSYVYQDNVNNYQYMADEYFHAGSIRDMKDYINTLNCGTIGPVKNTSPVILNMADSVFNIPIGTPFKLHVDAIDDDKNLTYTFDQMDARGGYYGNQNVPNATDVTGPLFRSRPPATSPTRYFPSLDVLSGLYKGTFEMLPTVARTLHFRATVRDNNEYVDGITQKDFTINVVAGCDTFGFTNFNADTALIANGTDSITLNWATAGCIPTNSVRIRFSVDGGKTYPYILLDNTANDGQESMVIPNLPTNSGRFMIEAVNNIYFNICKGRIAITSSCPVSVATTFKPDSTVTADAGSPALNLNLSPDYGTPLSNPITGTLTIGDNETFLVVPDLTTGTRAIALNRSIRYDTLTFVPSASGAYTFPAPVTSSANMYGIKLYEGDFNTFCQYERMLSATHVRINTLFNTDADMTVNLIKGVQYTLVVHSLEQVFNSTTTIPYNIQVSMPAGAVLYSAQPSPAVNNPSITYHYGYVIADEATGLIKTIKEMADLQDTNLYHPGIYQVYGVSTTDSITTLDSAFSNVSLHEFDSVLLSSQWCAVRSPNVKKVVVKGIVPDANGIVYVNQIINGGKQDGSSWANATRNLYKAILANGVQKVFVAVGNYNVPSATSFILKNNVAIYGGFRPGNGIDSLGDNRILPVNNQDDGSVLNGLNNRPVIWNVFNAFTPMDSTAVLDGFTIMNGYQNTVGGGGITNQYASPTLKNLVIRNNKSNTAGGGIYNVNSSAIHLSNAIVKDNTAEYGGGIYNNLSDAVLTNVNITNNTATLATTGAGGGGIFNIDAHPALTNVAITGNSTNFLGGALRSLSGNPVLTNVTISDNTAANSAATTAIDISAGTAQINNSIVFGTTAGSYNAQYSLIQGNTGGSNGNLNGDTITPQQVFNNPSAKDFSLLANAPVVDAGNNILFAGLDTSTSDLAGNHRLANAVIDMGAFEFTGSGTPTAIHLLSFTVQKQNENALLQWTTAQEQNCKGFELQHSTDSKNWQNLGLTPSKARNGNSGTNLNYEYTHLKPGAGNHFYRLKQLDMDGKYQYSLVRMVSFAGDSEINIYPNPANNKITITGLQGDETILIYDALGRMVMQTECEHNNMSVSLKSLKNGIYHVFITSPNNKRITFKLIKAE